MEPITRVFQVALVAHVAEMYPMVLPPRLKAVLEDEHIWKCGVGIQKDLEKLNEDFELDAKGFIDVGVVYTAYGNPEGGIKKMSESSSATRCRGETPL
eukprot:1190286-Prorocentrum_minimum.AAC.1